MNVRERSSMYVCSEYVVQTFITRYGYVGFSTHDQALNVFN